MHINSKLKGDIGEAKAITRLLQLHNPVSKPFGDNERYDLVVESKTGKLLKIQVKFSSEISSSNGLIFPLKSSKNHTTNRKESVYTSQIDYFILYHQITDELYVIPIAKTNNQKTITLRIDEPKNHQTKNILYADNFILNKQI